MKLEWLEEAREVLTGESGTWGLQAWLRREVESRSGYRPSVSTVHRWVKEGVDPPPEAREALEEIRAEARTKLARKMDALG